METKTLKEMLALVDARIDMYEKADVNDPFYKGAIAALKSLGGELQSFIETDISAMESTTGE